MLREKNSIFLKQNREGVFLPGGLFISFGGLFLFLLAGLSVFRFWLLSAVPISGDEAYHWEWSRHLAFSYYDHPGLTAWVIRFFTLIFGQTIIGVRAGALVSTVVVLIVIYYLGREAYQSQRIGFMGFALAAFTALFAASSLMMTTDPPYAAFWALAVFFLYQAIFRDRPGFFYLAGIAFGFSMLGKFLGFIILPCILLFFLFSARHRFFLRRKEPYIACLLALLILTPVFYWNARHDWATFVFNFATRHEELKPHLLYFMEYLAGQSLLVSPLIFLPLIYILWKSWSLRASEKESRDFFLFSFTAPPLLAFAFVSIFERAGAHWPAVAYITGIPLFTGWFFRNNTRAAARYVYACLIISVLFLCAGHVFLLRPDLIPEYRYEANPQKINTLYLREYYGWKELGNAIAENLEIMGHEDTFLMSPAYTFSATISFYTPGQPFCHHFGPESMHGNNYRYWTDWEGLEGRDAIYIGLKELRGSEMKRLSRAFRRIETLKPLYIYSRGKLVRKFYLTRGYQFKGNAPR